MFRYISGNLMERDTASVVIDVGGVGFHIFTSLYSLGDVASVPIGGPVTFYTFLYIKEGIMDLYGFSTKEELSMFELLISVSGVGAKGAAAILSAGGPSKIAISVVTGDAKTITRAQGIGQKTAQRIILELKDKIKNESLTSGVALSALPEESDAGVSGEAISALMVLGYSKAQAEKAVLSCSPKLPSVEEIIKAALKNLA